MKYNPTIHHRQTIRLKGYDYSAQGAYFVTICTENRQNLFGEIIDDKIILNNKGKMIEKWLLKLNNKYPHIVIDKYVFMPNHFHGIFFIVGADPCVCPNDNIQITEQDKWFGVKTWVRADTWIRPYIGLCNGLKQ